MTTGNLTLKELIEELEALTPDAIPTTIGRDGKESLIAGVALEAVGDHVYAVLRPGHEVV
jgi:hypothetical protein